MNHNLLQRGALRAALFVLLLSVAGTMKVYAQAHVFSVSENTQVVFSPGNLQYQATTNTWRFAFNQWDYVGADNANASETYVGWIDLFGWGTSGYNHGAVCYQPWSTSTTDSDYYAYGQSTYNLYDQTGQADWGYNAISNGGNSVNTWRTLTHEEWAYVFYTRNTSSGIRYARAKVNNVNGVILLPDDWNTSYYTLNNTNTGGANYSGNTITANVWENNLGSHGAVFLPAAGYRRDGTWVYGVGSSGLYWSASYDSSGYAGSVYFDGAMLSTDNYVSRYHGQSVRLVRFLQNFSFGINASPSPAEGGAVSGSGAYEAVAVCTLTATPSAGYDFSCWTENGMVVSTSATYSFPVVSDRNLVANFVASGNIEFADANVKAICVANWDANGDGELSYAESAAVTSLGTVFRDNTTVTSFNELQYFTRLDVVSANAFYGCSNLSSIRIPASVVSIGNNAFNGCTALTSVYYAGDVAGWCAIQFSNESANPLCNASLLYINNSLVRNLEIPNAVTSIGNYAFYNYKTLLSLQLPNALESIGNSAFYGCSGITSELTFPNTLTYLGDYAFSDCSGLFGSLTLPNALTSIGLRVFSNCSGLKGNLTLPLSITKIGEGAFSNCRGLTGGLTLPNTITSIGANAFSDCIGLTGNLVLPNALSNLGEDAFYNCRGFTGILTLPESLSAISNGSIYNGMFGNCDGLIGVIIPNSMTYIGKYSFYDCDGLTFVTIGTGISQIGTDAFYSCNNLKEVNFNATGCSSGNLFRNCSNIQALTIGENVLTLGDNAFTYCTNLNAIRCLGNNPPVITSTVFNNSILESVEVYVPCEAKTAYQADPIWGNFTNYKDSAYELLVESEDASQGSVSIEKHGNCDDPTSTVKASPNLHYGFSAWLKNGEVVSTDRVYTFNLDENMTLVARFEPSEVITNYWTARNFKNYKPVKGIITIDGVEQFRETLEVGAFCGDECRASVCAMWFPPTEQYVVNLTIGTDLDTSGELITFRIYDHELNEELNVTSTSSLVLEDFDPIGTINNWFPFSFSHEVSVAATVNPNGAGEVTGTGDYLPGAEVTLTATANEGYVFRDWTLGGQTVSTENPYTFAVTEAVNLTARFDRQQSQALVAGWNWWSTYIEQNGVDGLSMLENSLGHNGSLIMTQGVNVENYYSQLGYDYWWGNLSNVQNEKSYKIMVSEPCAAMLTGATANPKNHPISIQSSWNWIGYPCSASQYIANATFQPSDGDVVVTQGSNATYFNGYGWWPDFVMEPGKGYQYYSTDSNTKNMVFSNVREEVPVVKDGDLHWTARNFKNYKPVKGIITIDGVEQFSDRYEIGAFCGDECRASVRAMFFPPTSQYVVNLTIGTDLDNGNDLITFRIYDHETEQELNLESTSTLTLDNFDPMGTINNWFPFSFVTPSVSYNLDIIGYGNSAGGYYLIAPPFDDVNPDEIEGMTTGDYDLYYFDQAQDLEWINYKSGHFNLASGKGYLYAHKTDVTLTFTGMPYNGDGKVTLRKTGGLEFEGWNLVGNPYVTTATIDRDCYVMKDDGSEIIAGESRSVAAMQGVFVIAAADNEEMTFVANGTPEEGAKIALNILGNDRDNATIDRAIIRLGNEGLLPKCMLNPENTKVYIPQSGQDYAVVSTNSSEAELPVNFKANEDGVYTLSVDIKNAEMRSLHLIDNLTGANIDLLSQPTYSFTATSADSVNRFRLVFGMTAGVEEQCASGNDFAYVSNGEIMVSGTGYDELQVVDMTGRVVAIYKDTTRSLSTSGMAKGVYLLRLIGSDSVKTQKIVVE